MARLHFNVFVTAHAIIQVEAETADQAEALVQGRIDEDRFPVYSLARITVVDTKPAIVADGYMYPENTD